MQEVKRQRKIKACLVIVVVLLFSTLFAITTANAGVSNWVNKGTGIGEVIGEIGSKASEAISGIGESLTNYIADTILDGAVGWAGNLYEEGVTSIISFAFDGFRPDVATFNKYVPEEYFQILPTFGYIVAILLFATMLLFSLGGAIQWAEVKETPWQLVGGLTIALWIIYNSEGFMNLFFFVADSFWDMCLDTQTTDITSEICNMAVPKSLIVALGLTSTSVIGIIVLTILGVIFIKSFFRFGMEVIERYIVAIFLRYICPLAAATIVSKNASAIFKKYMQMVIVQLFMLLMNLIFIRSIAQMIGSGLTYTFTGFLFLLGFMKVGQRIDNYAFTMGLSVAVTGGNVLDSVSNVGRNLFSMARGMQMGAGIAGNTLVSKGASMGDLSMLKKGMDMQNLSRRGGAFAPKTSNGEAINRAARMGAASDIAKTIKPNAIDASMAEMARTGRNTAILNEMPMESKKALFEQAYGDGLLPENASIESLAWDKQGNCVGQLDVSEVGLNGEEGAHHSTAFKVTDIATNDAVSSATNANGTSFYLTSNGCMQEGESISVNPQSPASVSSAEMISGMNLSSLGDMKDNISSLSMGANGSVVAKDADGDVLARMEKGRNGKMDIAFNDDFALSSDSINQLPSMKHLDGIYMQNNNDGTVSLLGRNRTTQDVEQYKLYNKAVYTKNDVETATGSRVYAGFGNRNRATGSWYVAKKNIRTKEDRSNADIAYSRLAQSGRGKNVMVPRYKEH